MRSFTHYWRNTLADERIDETSDEPLVYVADTRFGQRGVNVGDEVFVVSIAGKRLFLIGKLVVGLVTADVEEAARLLGRTPEDTGPRLIYAFAARATPMSAAREVPAEVASRLQFRTARGLQPPKTRVDGTLDPQTLRTPRELSEQAAAQLDTLLPPPIPVALPPSPSGAR